MEVDEFKFTTVYDLFVKWCMRSKHSTGNSPIGGISRVTQIRCNVHCSLV